MSDPRDVPECTNDAPKGKVFILIVDPDPRLEKVLCRHLGFDAFEMLFVPNAAHARQVVRTRTPDLLVVESRLPDARGCDFMEYLSGLPAYADQWPLPVIYYGMLPGGTDRIIVPRQPGEPMFSLFKPVYPPELLLYIRRLLRAFGMGDGSSTKQNCS